MLKYNALINLKMQMLYLIALVLIGKKPLK